MQKKTELTEQQAVIEWCEVMSGQFPELKTIYHIPNEGKRSRIESRRTGSVPACFKGMLECTLHRNEERPHLQMHAGAA